MVIRIIAPAFLLIAGMASAGAHAFVEHATPQVGRNGGRDLIMPLPTLLPGQYTVVLHVTSQDTHQAEGRFSFTVAP